MRASAPRRWILNVFKIGKPGQKLTEKQQVLKEDLERSYFRDMNELSADPFGKLFPAQLFSHTHQMQKMPLLETPLRTETGEEKRFTGSEMRKNKRSVFLVYQMAFYAAPYANEWRERLVRRWPHMADRVYGVEIRERNLAYSLLRWATRSSVAQKWQTELNPEVETAAERLARLVHWQETRSTHMETRALRKALGVDRNKYLPFVFVVQEDGLINFKAVGKPKKSEFELLAKSLQ